MNITRKHAYGLPILLLPAMAAVAMLWPVQPIRPEPAPPADDQSTSIESDIPHARATVRNIQSITNSQALVTNPDPVIKKVVKPKPAQLSYRGDRKENNQIITKDGRIFPLRTYKTLLSPNDPGANQWWVAPNGMAQVWDIPAGAKPSKIAIIDTGFALAHQEFNNRWAYNLGESGITTIQRLDGPNCTTQGKLLDKSCNGLDDDNNQLVDDSLGWDFVNLDASVQAGETNPNGTGTTHGTKVAGVAAATGNNGVGVAGVNWYSSILPIQALNDDSYGDSFTVAQSIYYAADQKADVISISLGTETDDPYMHEAIQYALEAGSVVVAAAGNDACDCISYPANYPEVIAVGASQPNGTAASFSSYGANLDLIAPGQSMTSSTWSPANGTSAYSANLAGTSFSAPFVSGLLGLGRTYQPDANWLEITGSMLEKADKRTLTTAAPRTNQLGYGFVRANTMLDRLRTPNTSIQRYSFNTLSAESSRAYQCDMPSTLLYELSSGSLLRSTTSPGIQQKAASQGWANSGTRFVCIGLPTDTTHYLRVINLGLETKNRQAKP